MSSDIEIERKYVIRYPNPSDMQAMADYDSSEITQIYLNSRPGVTHRIRRRVYATHSEYTETKKVRIDALSCFEDENEITEAAFLRLSENLREGSRPITKTRHTFTYRGAVIEIDVYPEWQKCAVLETEMPSRDSIVPLPSFIEVVADVTGRREYSNSRMSEVFPDEPAL